MRTALAAGAALALTLIAVAAIPARAQQPPAGPPQRPLSPWAQAPIDVTGYWVSIVNEDWRWRMVTPPKGDYQGVPLSAEGRRAADAWDPAADAAAGAACRAYGVGGLMRLPTRLHITWQDDQTLRIDSDAGEQTRLLRFAQGAPAAAEADWQGRSTATWEKQAQARGFNPRFPSSGPGVLKVVTAFTLAHSVTLTLATLGIVALPSRLIESLIAASVVLAALNNVVPLVQRRLWLVAFAFGLVHGLGFATVLAELGLPRHALAVSLVAFNLGVELGQLAIVALLLPLIFALRETSLYPRLLLRAGSSAIAALGGLWLLERAFDLRLL